MVKIKVRYCTEDFISRIPALFAYIEYDEYGKTVLHKATDSDNGCYGKYVENVKYGEEYVSFRTLYISYYELLKKNERTEEDEKIIGFFDEAVGKKETDMEKFEEWQDLVPTYVYLATAKSIRENYLDLKKVRDYFEAHKSDIKDAEEYERICCKARKYERMGGDVMLAILNGYCTEAQTIAEKYYGLAAKEEDICSYTIHVLLKNSVNDNGILTPYVDEWVAGEEYKKGEIITYDGRTMICTVEKSTGEYDFDLERIVFPENDFKLITEVDGKDVNYEEDYEKRDLMDSIHFYGKKYVSVDTGYKLIGYTESKLRSLRRLQDYQNEYDKVETSGIVEDWLYYYRVGVVHYKMEHDEFGNILTVNYDNEYEGGDRVSNLMAYGSGIESIEADKENKTITFKYYENAHLSAKKEEVAEDDDGNKIYYFSDFQADKDSEYGKHHGVWYEETYTYKEGSDLETLINDGGLDAYVSMDNETIDGTKYEFSTLRALSYKDVMVGTDKIRTCHILSDFETNVLNNDISESYTQLDTFKQEWFDGITYQPVKNIDVNILRGNNAAFERHIKLGELRSLEDLMNYSNGGFYRVEITE